MGKVVILALACIVLAAAEITGTICDSDCTLLGDGTLFVPLMLPD